MACDEYKALLPEQAEGKLTADQERLLKDHLRNCDSCRSTLRLLRMDDKAIEGALLGIRPEGTREPPPGRGIRVILVGTILVLLVLVTLFGVYRGLSPFMADDSGPWGDPSGPPEQLPDRASLETVLEWDGDSLGEALDAVSAATGEDIVIDPPELPVLLDRVPGDRPVSGPAKAVLAAVLRGLGLSFDLRFGVIYVGSPGRLAALPATSPALPPHLANKSVTLSFAGLSLGEALDTLARLQGIEIVMSVRITSRASEDRITLDFRGIALADALSLLLAPRGLTFVERGGMIVVRQD